VTFKKMFYAYMVFDIQCWVNVNVIFIYIHIHVNFGVST